MEITQLEEIMIWCMGCRDKKSLEDAVRSGWVYCGKCHHFICDFCYSNLLNNRCLSAKCSSRDDEIQALPIPVESILLFSKYNPISDEIDPESLVGKILYKEDKIHSSSYQVKSSDEASHRDVITREEAWKNNKLVLTRRLHGKFIAWEKIF